MEKYYQLILNGVATLTWTYIPAGTSNDYSKKITEDDSGWLIQSNPDSEAAVIALGARAITKTQFTAYFIPGSRPPHKPPAV